MGATCAQCAPVELEAADSGGAPARTVSISDLANEDGFPGQRRGCYKVQLAVTAIGGTPVFGNIRAYHTSIVIDNMEYSFGDRGVCVQPLRLQAGPSGGGQSGCGGSHRMFSGPLEVITLGHCGISGPCLGLALKPFFRKGTYDLLRKNCNSFTDCALFYLLGERLDEGYCGLERIGAFADSTLGVIQALSRGGYMPNPKADDFCVERAVKALAEEKCAASRHNLDALRQRPKNKPNAPIWDEAVRARARKMAMARPHAGLQCMEQAIVDDGAY